MVQLAARPNVVVLFAGAGGACRGISDALGRDPAVAINHDQGAIGMHALNFRGTRHLCENLLKVQPFRPRGRAIDLLWASPDCTDHSRAKGGKPRETGRRYLAWIVLEWARAVLPRVIALENVPEFEEWGPLYPEDHPDPRLRNRRIPERRGETFAEFVAGLRLAGYRVEWRVLNAADYGAPTARKRLFMLARCDGQPIPWPAPTHGPERLPWRTAAECIDWSIPCRSIFTRRRELAPATQRRIAEGIRRYVLQAARPFVVCLTHGARCESIDEPMRTITTAGGGERAVVVPSLIRTDMTSDGHLRGIASLEEPTRTITTAGGIGLVAPVLVQTGYGERPGQAPRALDIGAPLGTVVAGGQKHGLVSAFLTRDYGGGPGGKPNRGGSLEEPTHTVTAQDHHRLVGCELTPEPAGHCQAVAAFLTKFYGSGGQWSSLADPMHTISTIDRMGLVVVHLDGHPYVISDIGFRMLEPRELATAQGFGPDYVLVGTKREQVARIGNAVCPPVARAITAALFGAAGDPETVTIAA
jgi:DNA (cytosine-5)-methyltransferase 1